MPGMFITLVILGVAGWYLWKKNPQAMKSLVTGKRKPVSEDEVKKLENEAAVLKAQADREERARNLKKEIRDTRNKINGVKS